MRRIIRMKVNKIVGFLVVIASFFVTENIIATVPVPSGFSLLLSDTGVKVYKKSYTGGQPDYVTVVDLRYGTIRNLTGSVSGSSVSKKTLSTFYSDAVSQDTTTRKTKVAVNGTFFDTNSNPAGIAFGLKADWMNISYGYGANNEFPGLIRTFALDSSYGSSSIQPYSTSTFDSGIPNVIGGLDPSADKQKTSNIARTFVGVRDDDNNGNSETVVFFSSAYATQAWAVNILTGFGTGSKMMLDGGGSTGFIMNGTSYVSTSRLIPQSFIICAGK
jgi:hypothetical protein